MNAAILVAAGKGARMGAGVDKLFLDRCRTPRGGPHLAAVRGRKVHR